MSRMATGVKACTYYQHTGSRPCPADTDLEHLDERHAQAEVRKVGQDQTAGEEGADRKNGSHPLIALVSKEGTR
jgi:hypothetical protein